VEMVQHIETEVDGLEARASLVRRRELISEADVAGLLATPHNSAINELVVEAARRSIASQGAPVKIVHSDHPHVEQN